SDVSLPISMVMNRRMLADSHWNIPFYFERTCTDRACHPGLEKNTHSLRANISCRQCHGGEPISSIGHYYSPMNPIRRHAYVCAKCHEGAGASFARYLVHEPNPLALETRTTFPKLYYSTWAMTLLVVGTLAFFLVHTGLWIIRELITRRREHGGEA
ncbi:MAG: hypothetical protein KKC99_09530, partial [Proteobacteria bacterium]|nr:hypothetical protein [Pseudomonadota bacterium]